MLKAIAIDDEPIALEVIKSLATEIGVITIIETFTNPFKAIGYLQQNQVDLLFLDINMPGISGIDLLKTISSPPMAIFTTAYSEHAVQSFELDVIDYLLKPFSLPRFLKACNKAHEQYEMRKNKEHQVAGSQPIFLKSGYEEVRINPADIVYAESAGNYVNFILTNGKLTSRLTMADAAELLPAPAFLRIHRSFIVATKHISKADRKTVWMGKTELPVGTAYSPELEKFIGKNKQI